LLASLLLLLLLLLPGVLSLHFISDNSKPWCCQCFCAVFEFSAVHHSRGSGAFLKILPRML
jgi:hypothetical protein